MINGSLNQLCSESDGKLTDASIRPNILYSTEPE